MTHIRFENQVAVVTGAGAGIGRDYALDLAKRGAKVVVNDVGYEENGKRSADQVVKEIIDSGGQAVANYDSVATMSGGRSIIHAATNTFDGLDILINNAGILRDRTFMKMSEDEFDEVINVHLKGAFCVTQPAVRFMKENNYGRIIFTTSTSGLYGAFGQSNYGAAKMGVIGIMNSLKLEVSKYNIKINAVAPNASTKMTEGVFSDEIQERIKPKFNTPIVTFLCSKENNESGMIFTMSAGWFARSVMVSNPGVCIGDTKRDITAEEIRDNFDKVKVQENGVAFDQAGSLYQLGRPLTGR